MAHKTQLRTKEPESEYSKSTNDQATATNTNPGPMEEEPIKENKQGDNPSRLTVYDDRCKQTIQATHKHAKRNATTNQAKVATTS
jgi:hypothetical protein